MLLTEAGQLFKQEVEKMIFNSQELKQRASAIKLLLTDVDGVLTDNGVYYSANGEELKRFSFRDGMGVERLKKLASVETGIITRENSKPVARRAEKLNIRELHFGILDKSATLDFIIRDRNLSKDQIAYIGDDVNDKEIMERVGLCACPSDAMGVVKGISHYICRSAGGHGAFREFAELIVESKN